MGTHLYEYGAKPYLLDKANTSTYGKPGNYERNIGVGKEPCIFISGHDLRDIQDLLNKLKVQA